MTNRNISTIKEALSVLIGTPLREFDRSGPMLVFNFGDLIEVDDIVVGKNRMPVFDENGKGIPTKSQAGRYALDALCSMRFACGNDVVLAKSDIFIPTDEQISKDDFVWDTFDWHTHGNTLFDELLERHFRGDFSEYIVKSVKVGKFGDLTITFENDFVLEFFADGSGHSENWRFGETNSTESLIVTSKGIIDESF